MKRFKIIDFWISTVSILLGFIIIIFFYQIDFIEIKLVILAISFFWGLWQITSIIVHLFDMKNWEYFTVRLTYSIFEAIILVYSIYTNFNDIGNIVYLFPIMTIFYTCLCGFEVYATKKINNQKV
jgi:hypothetical protein